MTDTLADAYPMEQARVRELLQRYDSLRGLPGVNVSFAIAALNDVLRRADKASAEHDTVAMIRCLQEMRDCE